jgi:hypothetical protein
MLKKLLGQVAWQTPPKRTEEDGQVRQLLEEEQVEQVDEQEEQLRFELSLNVPAGQTKVH